MADLTGKPEPRRAWWEVPCASRMAYGCGDNVQEAAQGLVLYARLGDGPHLDSSLAIRMTEAARRRFELELDPDYYRRRDAELPSDLIGRARVEMAEEHGVTAILLSFTRPACISRQPDLLYYLVYDTIGRSLSMFQILPDPCEGVYHGVCTLRPIVPERTDGRVATTSCSFWATRYRLTKAKTFAVSGWALCRRRLTAAPRFRPC